MEQKETWEEIEPEFYLLKPRLAVSAGRKNIPKAFYNLIMATMNKVDIGDDEEKIKSFKTFVAFFESIVAYHKYHEEMRDWA
jgi:CRISPR type III-A/MTUBE-associated protein Csm2